MCNLVSARVVHRSYGTINSGIFWNTFFVHHGAQWLSHEQVFVQICSTPFDDWILIFFPMSVADRKSSADSDGIEWVGEWVSGWVREGVSEWASEGVSEWVNLAPESSTGPKQIAKSCKIHQLSVLLGTPTAWIHSSSVLKQNVFTFMPRTLKMWLPVSSAICRFPHAPSENANAKAKRVFYNPNTSDRENTQQKKCSVSSVFVTFFDW